MFQEVRKKMEQLEKRVQESIEDIDSLVYELYHLSSDEISIMNASNIAK